MTCPDPVPVSTDLVGAEPTVSEARLLSVLNTAVDGIVVIDESGRVLMFNKACERLFGYPAADVIGQNVSVIMPPDYAAEHDRYLANYRATGEKRIIGIGREVRARHQDGTVFPVELSVGEARTPAGRQFIGIIRDLRQRKATEERLNQLQAQLVHMARINAMDEMGAAIAHEINQPLTAVMLYLQAVRRRLGSRPEVDATAMDVLDRAVKEAERAGSIIQRMRQMVEKRDPHRTPANLAALIAEALDLTLVGTTATNVDVRRHVAPDMPPVEIDTVQIQQVVVNLIRNAIEAVRERETRWIDIAARIENEQAIVEVTDSGPGIPPDAVRTLFKAFSTTKRTGLGLGLAISRSIAQNHGGDLSVDAGGGETGRGARFRLSLPLAKPPAGSPTGRDDD